VRAGRLLGRTQCLSILASDRESRSSVSERVGFALTNIDVPLIGVAPEKEIQFPRINPTKRHENELTNGHTHFVLIGNEDVRYDWGDETQVKFDLAKRIAAGRATFGGSKFTCKIITIMLGDNPYCVNDIEMVTLLLHKESQAWHTHYCSGGLTHGKRGD